MCITHNHNAVIINNHGSLRDLILLFKIPLGTRKDVFEIYLQFWQAALKWFAIHTHTHAHICIYIYIYIYIYKHPVHTAQ